MADEKQTLGELVASLQAEYGEHQYGRIDLHIDDSIKNAAIARAKAGVDAIAGMKVLRVATLDGIKFFLDNPEAKGKPNAAETWLLLRASGTEPSAAGLLGVVFEGVGCQGAAGGERLCYVQRGIIGGS